MHRRRRRGLHRPSWIRPARADARRLRRGLIGVLVEAFGRAPYRPAIQLGCPARARDRLRVVVWNAVEGPQRRSWRRAAPLADRPAGPVPAGDDPVLSFAARCCSWPTARSDPAGRVRPDAGGGPGLRRGELLAARVWSGRRSSRSRCSPSAAMLLFPAANDLLTLFVALEVLLPPAVPDVRAGPPPPAALAGGGAQVLPAGCVLVGVLPLRRGARLRLLGLACGSAGSRRPSRTAASAGSRAARGHRPAGGRPALQGRRRAVPLLDPRRLPGRPDRRSPASWPPAPRSAAFGALLRVFYVALAACRWDWRPMLWIGAPSSR